MQERTRRLYEHRILIQQDWALMPLLVQLARDAGNDADRERCSLLNGQPLSRRVSVRQPPDASACASESGKCGKRLRHRASFLCLTHRLTAGEMFAVLGSSFLCAPTSRVPTICCHAAYGVPAWRQPCCLLSDLRFRFSHYRQARMDSHRPALAVRLTSRRKGVAVWLFPFPDFSCGQRGRATCVLSGSWRS
jgi:hypothetical protein